MATEMITLKLDDEFLKEIDTVVKKHSYQNRTEFIREALRDKVEETKIRETMIQLSLLKGASKKKVTDEEYERARNEPFENVSWKLK